MAPWWVPKRSHSVYRDLCILVHLSSGPLASDSFLMLEFNVQHPDSHINQTKREDSWNILPALSFFHVLHKLLSALMLLGGNCRDKGSTHCSIATCARVFFFSLAAAGPKPDGGGPVIQLTTRCFPACRHGSTNANSICVAPCAPPGLSCRNLGRQAPGFWRVFLYESTVQAFTWARVRMTLDVESCPPTDDYGFVIQ